MTERPLTITLKRVYEVPDHEDGPRILVERLWPRGLTKEKAAIDHWVKGLAPSPELRSWYGHIPERWPEFQSRYRQELSARSDALEQLANLCRSQPVTFVYAAKDETRNSALLLRDVLLEREETL